MAEEKDDQRGLLANSPKMMTEGRGKAAGKRNSLCN
jgi:hypothetical protein